MVQVRLDKVTTYVLFGYQRSHGDHKGGSSVGEHQHQDGDADLSHRVTVTLRLSVHVRGLDKWTIVPTSRSDHRVTASHRINPLLVWALHAIRSSPGNLLDDASLHQEYTCCWQSQKGGRGAG